MSQYNYLLKPVCRKLENWFYKKIGYEIPCSVRHTINALWEETDIRPKIYQERKSWGWEFKIYVAPGDSHSDIIKCSGHFESITGCECVFFSKGKALIMRVIEKPIGKHYKFNLEDIGINDYEIKLPIGYDVHGELQTFSLDNTYHVLVGGPTRTGKSNTLSGWIYTLLNNPLQPEIIVGDCKRCEFSYLKNRIKLFTTVEEIEGALEAVELEMRRRMDLFYDVECENFKEYRKYYGEIKRIVVIIDELGEVKSKKAIAHIDALLRLAAATGIHLILASQRPSSSFLGKESKFGDLKSNLIGRLAFSCSSKIDTNMILDQYVTMKKIPGRALWRTTDDALIEIQAPLFDRRAMT
ncbi:FtsK/SpoIIIE family protein [Anaerospora hongkongensis]|uniref:FtsK/SpoIIIE family protein n=1 Tax=Anaerospora hongkongensis TaxID=244830 RepID=A0A4R1QBW5_9FIRM|nr:FtsK/SpoIIIE domain-containing protein [Anaerospora hongkongensis]TCL39931.1 FtsK/SpoIIIE family protein [Anaerospora hongkongensis]